MSTQIPISGLKNQVAVADGSAAVPSISFAADSNTGFYRPAADTLGVVTGGVERMRVGSTGHVGIQDLSLGNQLNLSGENLGIVKDGVEETFVAKHSLTDATAESDVQTIVQRFTINNANYLEGKRMFVMMRITDAEGGVRFRINGTTLGALDRTVTQGNTNLTDNSVIWYQFDITDYVYLNNVENILRLYAVTSDGYSINSMVTFVASHYLKNGEPFTQDVLMLNSLSVKGNVGIGITNPQAKLDVQGSIKSLNPCFYAYRIGTSSAAFTTVGGVFPLNNTEVNVQNVYDTTNYLFTAPVAGIYRFSVGALHRGGSAGSTLELTIEKRSSGTSSWVNNGNPNTASSRRALTYSYTPSGGGHSMVTGFAMRSLNAGDSIRFILGSLVTSGDVYIGEGFTYFEGYLIG